MPCDATSRAEAWTWGEHCLAAMAITKLQSALVLLLQHCLAASFSFNGAQDEENDEAADEDPAMEGELTSADYRKLQSLVDEQEKAVEAGALTKLHKLTHMLASRCGAPI